MGGSACGTVNRKLLVVEREWWRVETGSFFYNRSFVSEPLTSFAICYANYVVASSKEKRYALS
jgi:hypothetical protein